MSDWQPIETAPKDGTRIIGIMRGGVPGRYIYTRRKTYWGKTSHVPLYGWNYGRDVEDQNLWHPTHWKPEPRK